MTARLKKIMRVFIIVMFTIAFMPIFESVSYANGQLVIPHPPMPRHSFQPLTLDRQEVNVTIDGQIAKTHIKQIWRNHNHMDLEGEFLFPLPTDRATMSDFVLWMDGKKLTFETMEAGKAKQIYEDIVRQMRDPGLLEYAGDGLLKCRIYPIPAHGTKEIELEYREVLTKEGTLSKYAFPLEIRNLPKPIGTLLLDVNITSNSPMGKVYSPTHDVGVDMRDSRHARVTLEKSSYMPLREFVLFMSHPQNEFGVELITHKIAGEDGFFLGLISPGFDYDTSAQKAIPKDFLFILDTSGSMEGEKIVQAKEALKYILRNLNQHDRFSIISFSTEVSRFKNNLVSTSEVNNALKYVDGLSAVGGTFIDGALKEGLSFEGSQERPFYIIFLTDGLATVGEQDISRILANVEKANERNARIFSFGVGNDVNISFIDKLARENGGASTNVSPTENIEVPLSNLYQKIKSPVLTDLNINIDGVHVFDFYPQKFPDLFKGGQIVVTGRYTGGGNAKITLSGKLGGTSTRTFNYTKNFDNRSVNDFIPPLWANRKVGYLMNQIRLYGENQELIDQIITLAKKHGIVTPYTSYLVLEDGFPPPPGTPIPLRGGVAFNMDSTTGAASPGHERTRSSGLGGGMAQGSEARAKSQTLQKQEQAESLDDVSAVQDKDAQQNVQQVKNKTFILQDEYWVDSDYDPEDKLPEVEIEFMSDEYFELLDIHPDIGNYLAVGEQVKLVWNKQLYIITQK